MGGDPVGMTVYKRYSPDYQSGFPLLIPDGPLGNSKTILKLSSLDKCTNGHHVIELADTHIVRPGNVFSLWTPLRHGARLLDDYHKLTKGILSCYTNDLILSVPMGVFPWTAESEASITNQIQEMGGVLTVGEYLAMFNKGNHFAENAAAKIGQVRALSKMSRKMVENSSFDFKIVGYSPGDFGQICLASR